MLDEGHSRVAQGPEEEWTGVEAGGHCLSALEVNCSLQIKRPASGDRQPLA